MKIEQFFKNYDTLREVVAGIFEHLGHQRWKRVEVLMLMLRMMVYYQASGKGLPFASANWYAANSFCSEKTVDRLVSWLRDQGFARTRRLRRRDTEAAWVSRNSRGDDNQGWQELAVEYGPGSPFKVYPPGFFSTNEIDLRPLIAKLLKLLGTVLNQKVGGIRVYRDKGGVIFKAWFPVNRRSDKPPRWPVESYLPVG